MKNILILTCWSYKDLLIQTYTLPCVRIIKRNLPEKSRIYLFTLEQEFFRMTDKEWQQEKEELAKEKRFLVFTKIVATFLVIVLKKSPKACVLCWICFFLYKELGIMSLIKRPDSLLKINDSIKKNANNSASWSKTARKDFING